MVLKNAKLVLTSYDLPNIEKSILTIVKNAPKFKVEIKDDPVAQKVGQFTDEPKLWGCDGKDVKRKAIMVSGYFTDMQNLVRIQTPKGVLVELLPTDNYT